MNKISTAIKKAIAAEARAARPSECCGFVVNGDLVPCKNVHDSPLTNFAISAEDYARAEGLGVIEAVYHSHVSELNQFSRHDIQACKQLNIPWIIYHLHSGDFHYGDPTGKAPYEGREWIYGLHDCYSLVRDFYLREFQIELDDFYRGEDEEWLNSGWSMFTDNYESQGFKEVGRPDRRGDVLLMQLQSDVPNHTGVMIGGGNRFYQHLSNRLSLSSVYGGYWAKVTVKVLRHKDL